MEEKVSNDNGRLYIMPVRSVISLWLKPDGLQIKEEGENIIISRKRRDRAYV